MSELIHSGHDIHKDLSSDEAGQGTALARHPHPWVQPPTAASLRMVCFDEVERFAENQKATAGSPMVFSAPARNGVRLPSGMAVQLGPGSPSRRRA